MSEPLQGLQEYAPEWAQAYIPDNPFHQALASMAMLGLLGQGYRSLAPSPGKPKDILPAREVRIVLPEREKEKESMRKTAVALPAVAQFGLGAIAPLGVYGLYKAVEQAQEDADRRRLVQKAEYLRKLTDPANQYPAKRASSRAADELLGDLILTKMAVGKAPPSGLDDFLEGLQGVGSGLGKYLQNFNPIMGGVLGTAGLAAYLAARRQLLPRSVSSEPVDIREATLTPEYLPLEQYAGRR